MNVTKFKEGDLVKIESPGLLYSTYQKMALDMQLKNFCYNFNKVRVGDIGKIVAQGKHEHTNVQLCGIKLIDSNIDIIIEYEGVSFYKRSAVLIDDNLFELD